MKKNLQNKTVKAELEMAIDQLFGFANYDQLKEGMWEWLKATICGDFHTRIDTVQKDSLLVLFERINACIDAAHKVREMKR